MKSFGVFDGRFWAVEGRGEGVLIDAEVVDTRGESRVALLLRCVPKSSA